MSNHPLEEALHPKSIAVVGASPSGRGGRFVSPLIDQGFKGPIYPVNPKYKEINGLTAYGRVIDIPGPVDYVISSIPATAILELIDDCVAKKVKCVHLFTARFSETGRKDAADLEKELLRRARAGNVRLIGPNCMGVYYPEQGMAFNEDMPKTSGPVGLVSQSGQVVGEIVARSAARRIYFSKAISYGNALDFNECDYLEYFGQDPNTKIVLMYVEGLRDGPRFTRILKETTAKKPVIILKGGRGKAGTRATASHTASMAGSGALWEAMIRQCGAISVPDIEALIDVAACFERIPGINGRRTAVAGGSGGSSVQAADQCEEAGLDIIDFPRDIRETLKAEGSAIWDWIQNPADFSIAMGEEEAALRIMTLMSQHPDFDVFILFAMPPWRQGKDQFDLNQAMQRYQPVIANKPAVVVYQDWPRNMTPDRQWFDEISEQIKAKFHEMGVPVYPSVVQAARAINQVVGYWERRK
jgi:acyl-CoA synthetase (NDP forming)